jgi:carboxyl-terminal processing protease
LAVDGESLIGSTLTEAVNLVRGPKGSVVVLTILRIDEENPEGSEPYDVEVTRDRIETPTIATDTIGVDNDIAYIKLNTFNQNAGQLVRQAVDDALQHNVNGIVFDLRGNSGGLLREAVKVANIFLEETNILIERFADGREEVYRTTGKAASTEIPVVVLVNEGSASASEIVAGALQDNKRAKLLGTTTYGKGSVQLPHTLQGGSIMRVTVARWYTPLDRTIDGEGLQPDIVVELTEEDRGSDKDPQLDAALDLLVAEIGQ